MEIRPLSSGSHAGNCYYVSDGHTPLLLDCGIQADRINRALDFGIHNLAGVLVSHEHQDHAKGARKLAERGATIYTSALTADKLDIPLESLHEIRDREPVRIGTWCLTPFAVKHDADDPLGFHLRGWENVCLVYLTDTPYSPFTFTGMTHIMIEANYDLARLRDTVENGQLPEVAKSRIIRNHFSIDNAIAFLRANDLSRVQEIWLIHLSDRNSDAEAFKRRVAAETGKLVRVA